jgi:hypothetical protein
MQPMKPSAILANAAAILTASLDNEVSAEVSGIEKIFVEFLSDATESTTQMTKSVTDF